MQEMMPEFQVPWLQSTDCTAAGQNPGGQKQPAVSLASNVEWYSLFLSTKDNKEVRKTYFFN